MSENKDQTSKYAGLSIAKLDYAKASEERALAKREELLRQRHRNFFVETLIAHLPLNREYPIYFYQDGLPINESESPINVFVEKAPSNPHLKNAPKWRYYSADRSLDKTAHPYAFMHDAKLVISDPQKEGYLKVNADQFQALGIPIPEKLIPTTK